MLLSFQPPFLFVHVDRAAGSSIQSALKPVAGSPVSSVFRRRLSRFGRLNRWFGLHRRLSFPEHASISLVQRCLPPAEFARLFKFAFVRNPWDRLVSRYAHLLRSQAHHRHGLVKRMEKFEDYLNWEMRRGKMFQYPYVTGRHGEWLVDFVGYYEKIGEDFARVCARLKVNVQMPRSNGSVHEDYRTYYTPATRDAVARHFRRDIELLGYDFNGLVAPRGPGLDRGAEATPVIGRAGSVSC